MCNLRNRRPFAKGVEGLNWGHDDHPTILCRRRGKWARVWSCRLHSRQVQSNVIRKYVQRSARVNHMVASGCRDRLCNHVL